MKRLLILIFLLSTFYFLFSANPASAINKKLTLYYGRECPHCQKEEKFLDQLEKDYPEVKAERFEVWHNQVNQKKMRQIAAKFDNAGMVVPMTIINDQESILGYDSDETTGKEIKEKLGLSSEGEEDREDKKGQEIKFPIIGTINLLKLSLPALTVILGLIDGFNPCAMWALVALLAFLIGLNSRTKVLLIGGLFLLTSYLASFLYMSAWLNAFFVLQYAAIVKYLVAFASLIIAFSYLKDFIKNKQDCEVVDPKQRKKIFERMKAVGSTEFWLTAAVGTIILALTVNVIEFVCSFGLPLIFTQVLAEQNISGMSKYLYLLVYNLFYMLDDFVVFAIAVFSARVVGMKGIYSRWSRLVGAIILFLLAIWIVVY